MMNETLLGELKLLLSLRCKANMDTSATQLRHIINSVFSENFTIFLNKFDDPSGYVIWAKVNRETLLQLTQNGRMPQYPYEWNEGGYHLVLDILLIDDRSSDCRTQLIGFLKNKRAISYVRNGKFKLLVRNNGFFTQTSVVTLGTK